MTGSLFNKLGKRGYMLDRLFLNVPKMKQGLQEYNQKQAEKANKPVKRKRVVKGPF